MKHSPHFSIVDTYIRPTGICLRGIVTDATRSAEAREIDRTRLEPGDTSCWIENTIVETEDMLRADKVRA